MLPVTQYTRVGDVHIAYQVLGKGDRPISCSWTASDERGPHELKGVLGELRLYAVTSDDRP